MEFENEVSQGEEVLILHNKTALKADLALLLVALLWGGGFITAKVALYTFSPLTLLTFRFLGSGILMAIIFHKKMRYIPKHTLFSGMIIGVFMFVGMACQATGLKYTTASKQAFLLAAYTVLVPFISWFMTKKRPSLQAVLAGIMTLTGVGILSLTSSFTIQLGDALSLLYAVIFGAQIVCIGIFVRNVDMVQFSTIQLLTGGILTGICAIFFETYPKTVSLQTWFSVFYLVVLSTTLAFTVQNVAQKYTSDTHASIILSLQSLFGVFMAILFLGDQFTLRMGIGAAIIFIAVIFSSLEKKG